MSAPINDMECRHGMTASQTSTADNSKPAPCQGQRMRKSLTLLSTTTQAHGGRAGTKRGGGSCGGGEEDGRSEETPGDLDELPNSQAHE